MITVQTQPLIQTAADPRFSLSCNFTGAATEVRVVAGSLTVLRKPFQRKQETIRGNINQVYSLSIVNNTDKVTPVSSAMLGDRIALAVTMQGTDPDEQSLRVRRCVATNTRQTEVVLLDNYCPVLQTMIDGDSGFITSGTQAVLPGLQAFRIQDSPDDIVTFSCIVEPCNNAQACDGNNCGGQSVRRKRQSSEDDAPLLRLVVQYRVYDPQNSGTALSAGDSRQSSSMSDSTQLALLLTVAVVSALLIISVIGTIFIFCRLRKIKGDKSVDMGSS
ncbi:uncharacterized protein LOC135461330 [Liolophura sinensis]|uniref:uncharacterized protein LOC135461330 n=1 Tax=Liolophura sinensis TaxID=3198878 RepID=UPI003158FF7F